MRKGIIVILLFLVGIPLCIDLILAVATDRDVIPPFGMTGFLFARYLLAIPLYICYLIIAYIFMYIDRKSRNPARKSNKEQ